MKKNRTYMDSVHFYGRVWGIIVGAVLISFPIILSVIFGALPNGEILLKGIFATAPMYWAVGIIEIFTYVPMLGAGGTYLSFVTGNISNLKLPCAIDAMERANVCLSRFARLYSLFDEKRGKGGEHRRAYVRQQRRGRRACGQRYGCRIFVFSLPNIQLHPTHVCTAPCEKHPKHACGIFHFAFLYAYAKRFGDRLGKRNFYESALFVAERNPCK